MLTVTLKSLENRDNGTIPNGAEHDKCSLSTTLCEWESPRGLFRRLWGEMREVTGFFLFELGQVVLLSRFNTDVDLTSDLGLIARIRDTLKSFAEDKYNKEDLPDSVAGALAACTILDKIITRKPFPSISEPELFELVIGVLHPFRKSLDAELGRVYSRVLEEKGGRSVKTLWTKALMLLPSTVLPHVSEFVRENLEEAGKCWIVDRRTATGFHMMRSVECVLRVYSRLVSGKNSEWKDKDQSLRYDGFGKLTDRLASELDSSKANKRSFGQLEFVVGLLRPLGKLYRDPLAHPELKKLDEEDAKLAFEYGLSAISIMVQDAIDGGSHFKIPWSDGVTFCWSDGVTF